MTRKFLVCFSLFAFVALRGTCGFAQTTNSANDSIARQNAASTAAVRAIDTQQDIPRRFPTNAGTELNEKFLEFQRAIPKFREATNDYRWNLSMDGKLDKQLKDITAQTDVMLRYLSAVKTNHPRPNPAEFKDYSAAELRWETLNTAERIATFINFAVLLERQDIVSAKALEFLYTLDGELLRLKWLTTHTK